MDASSYDLIYGTNCTHCGSKWLCQRRALCLCEMQRLQENLPGQGAHEPIQCVENASGEAISKYHELKSVFMRLQHLQRNPPPLVLGGSQSSNVSEEDFTHIMLDSTIELQFKAWFYNSFLPAVYALAGSSSTLEFPPLTKEEQELFENMVAQAEGFTGSFDASPYPSSEGSLPESEMGPFTPQPIPAAAPTDAVFDDEAMSVVDSIFSQKEPLSPEQIEQLVALSVPLLQASPDMKEISNLQTQLTLLSDEMRQLLPQMEELKLTLPPPPPPLDLDELMMDLGAMDGLTFAMPESDGSMTVVEA